MTKRGTKTSAYRIALDLRFSGSSQIYYSGLFASRRQLEAALAGKFAEGQDTTCFLDAWPLELCVLEHYRGGALRARVDLSRQLRARLSDGRRIDLGEDDLVIEGIPDRHDEDHDAYLEVLGALATGDLRLELSIAWTGLKLGKAGPPLGSRAKSLRLESGFEHPRGWIGGDDAGELRGELDPIDEDEEWERIRREDEASERAHEQRRAKREAQRRGAWPGPTTALLFSLAELPLAGLLADVGEVARRVRSQTFYVVQAPSDAVEFPPETDNDYHENERGFRLLRIVEDWLPLPHIYRSSWNHGSSRAAVRAAFERAGWTVVELDSLAPDRNSTSAAELIKALQAEIGTGQLSLADEAWVRYLGGKAKEMPEVESSIQLRGRVALRVGKPIPKPLHERMLEFVLQGDGKDMLEFVLSEQET